MTTPPEPEINMYERVFAIFDQRDRRHPQRWVLSRDHVQAFHDVENERRARERERIAEIPAFLPGFDPTEHLERLEPLPEPDYAIAGGWTLMGLPIRIDDVDEMRLERL